MSAEQFVDVKGYGGLSAYIAAMERFNRDMQKLAKKHATFLEPIRRTKRKTRRNLPCPCGSGKKYKNCHSR